MSKLNDTSISKTMSYLLRHGALKAGLGITDDGWVLMNDLLKTKEMNGVTREKVLEIVKKDSKSRYSTEGEGDAMTIRANQGHSIEVKVEMKEITDATQYPVVLHGTYKTKLESIMKEGLKKMGRLHIHMAQGLPNQIGQQQSGMRSNCSVVIYIDLEKALNDGLKFYESENGVILCEGPIPPTYFKEVVSYPSKTKITI